MDLVSHIYRALKAEGYRGTPIHNLYRDEVQDFAQAELLMDLRWALAQAHFPLKWCGHTTSVLQQPVRLLPSAQAQGAFRDLVPAPASFHACWHKSLSTLCAHAGIPCRLQGSLIRQRSICTGCALMELTEADLERMMDASLTDLADLDGPMVDIASRHQQGQALQRQRLIPVSKSTSACLRALFKWVQVVSVIPACSPDSLLCLQGLC